MADDRDPVVPAILRDLQTGDVEQAWRDFLDHYAALILQIARLVTRDRDAAADAFLFACEKLRADDCARLRRFDPAGAASFPTWLRAVTRNLCVDWHRSRYGRLRPFAFLDTLPQLSRETFRLVYQERLSIDEAVIALQPRVPGLQRADVQAARDDLWRRLTPQQRHQLRSPREALESMASVDDISDPADEGPGPEALAAFRELRDILKRELAKLAPRDRLVLRLRFEQDLTLSAIARLTGVGTPQAVDRWIRDVLRRVRRNLS